MTESEKDLLKKIGEETIYTAKGYFKCFDSASIARNALMWLNLIIMIAVISVSLCCSCKGEVSCCCDGWQKALTILSLIDIIFLLYLEGACSNSYLCECHKLANTYLGIHKKVRSLFHSGTGDVAPLTEEVVQLDSQERPRIHAFARWLAKRAIEKNGEVDLWFK